MAVSAESITASVPSRIAFATSEASALPAFLIGLNKKSFLW
jgi:hypothetical protein